MRSRRPYSFSCVLTYWVRFWACCLCVAHAQCHRWRPYRVECTGSLPTSEVKRRRARLVLGWGTAREDLRVLPAFVPACLHSSNCCNNVFRANMDLRWRPCRVECSGFISPKLSGAGPGAGRWPGKASSCCRLACMHAPLGHAAAAARTGANGGDASSHWPGCIWARRYSPHATCGALTNPSATAKGGAWKGQKLETLQRCQFPRHREG